MSNYYQRRENGDGTYSEQVALTDSDAVLPIDAQYRKQKTVQTQSAVLIPPTNGVNVGAWVDTDGYNSVGVTMRSDASHPFSYTVEWSNDQATTHYYEAVSSTTSSTKGGDYAIKAKWFRLAVANTDGAAHTVNAWALLKV